MKLAAPRQSEDGIVLGGLGTEEFARSRGWKEENERSFTPAFSPSVVTFSNMNEDYQVELAVIDHLSKTRDNLRVATIASSGETALSILTRKSVATVDAIDLNAWQVYYSELRRTATLHLSRDDQLRLFGMHPHYQREVDEEKRLELYESIRSYLPETVRKQWDERKFLEVAFGLAHVGQSEIINHDLQVQLQKAGISPLQNPTTMIHNVAFHKAFEEVYCYNNFKRRFARLHISSHGMQEMSKRHAEVLQKPNITQNYFFHYYYTNYFTFNPREEEHMLPLFLQTKAQEQLLALGADTSRLTFHIGDAYSVIEQLANNSKRKFDVISISNIIDWVDENSVPALFDRIAQFINEGGALICRHETKRTSFFQEICQKTSAFTMDTHFNATLRSVDRALLSNDVVAFWRV